MKLTVIVNFLALCLIAVLLPGCAPASPDVSQLQECTLAVDGVFLVRGGSEFIVVTPVLTLSNPNPFDVVVRDVTYKFDTGQSMQIYDKFPYRYTIPAGDKVVLAGSGCLSLVDGVVDKVMNAGLPQKLGAAQILPFWKGLGGKAPAGVSSDMWNGMEGKSVTYTYEITFCTSAMGTNKMSIVKGTL